jgi:hypothetical protein
MAWRELSDLALFGEVSNLLGGHQADLPPETIPNMVINRGTDEGAAALDELFGEEPPT